MSSSVVAERIADIRMAIAPTVDHLRRLTLFVEVDVTNQRVWEVSGRLVPLGSCLEMESPRDRILPPIT